MWWRYSPISTNVGTLELTIIIYFLSSSPVIALIKHLFSFICRSSRRATKSSYNHSSSERRFGRSGYTIRYRVLRLCTKTSVERYSYTSRQRSSRLPQGHWISYSAYGRWVRQLLYQRSDAYFDQRVPVARWGNEKDCIEGIVLVSFGLS